MRGSPRIAIVGAGLAGLVCADTLQRVWSVISSLPPNARDMLDKPNVLRSERIIYGEREIGSQLKPAVRPIGRARSRGQHFRPLIAQLPNDPDSTGQPVKPRKLETVDQANLPGGRLRVSTNYSWQRRAPIR